MVWHASDLAYCSNVHPAADLPALCKDTLPAIAAVREHRGLTTMATGLWLSAAVAAELADDPDAKKHFAATLAEADLRLITVNGFPYGDFHGARVKEGVYRPDWSEPARSSYTLQLARLLVELLPDDVAIGSISTLPLGFARQWNAARHRKALNALCRLANDLAELHEQTGKAIRVCLEMEPACVLERTAHTVELFVGQLPEAANRLGISPRWLQEHLGVCFDICHQAVMFEEPRDSLAQLSDAGIAIGKIQVSSALEPRQPSVYAPDELLRCFAEPRYLHQVQTLDGDDRSYGVLDLPEALAPPGLARDRAWRVHFHVPIQATALDHPALGTTQAAILDVLDFLAQHPEQHPHLEVETYTWQVLPEHLRPDDASALTRGLTRELLWLEQALREHGLLR